MERWNREIAQTVEKIHSLRNAIREGATMRTQLVYRVRHEDEDKGPYKADWDGSNDIDEDHSNSPNHPVVAGWGWHFGFAKEEHLIDWFYDWLDRLSAGGFEVHVYIVPEMCVRHHRPIRERGNQVTFDPTVAELVEVIPL